MRIFDFLLRDQSRFLFGNAVQTIEIGLQHVVLRLDAAQLFLGVIDHVGRVLDRGIVLAELRLQFGDL